MSFYVNLLIGCYILYLSTNIESFTWRLPIIQNANELLDLLKIPSVSTDSSFEADTAKTAAEVKKRLEEAGADNV